MRGARTLLAVLPILGGCYLSHGPTDPDVLADPVPERPERCGDGVDTDGDGDDPPCPAAVCGVAPSSTSTARLSFPDPGGCPWSTGDNGSMRAGVFRARTEQDEPLPLPPH